MILFKQKMNIIPLGTEKSTIKIAKKIFLDDYPHKSNQIVIFWINKLNSSLFTQKHQKEWF